VDPSLGRDGRPAVARLRRHLSVRILHIPHAYWPVRGGAEHYCQRLSEELAARGHQVRVVTANVTSPEAFYQLGIFPVGPPREVHEGVEVVRIPFGGPLYRLAPPRPGPGRVARALLRRELRRFQIRLAAEIDTYRPDVVMTLPHLFANVRCVLEIHRRGTFPLVLVPLMHEDDPYWPREELREALRRVEAVVAATPYEVERLQNAYGVPSDRVFLAGAGVDPPADSGPSERRPQVLFLGRKAPSKGIDLLLAAMEGVWKERPEVELVLAGARVPMTDEVERLLDQLPEDHKQRIRSLDDVSEEEKHELLVSSSCLVLPSPIESLAIVLLEAWAHATPVVALDLPALRTILEPGRDGLLVQPGQPQELAQALLTLLDDPSRAAVMGTMGRQKVARRFTWDRVAGAYLEAYEYAVGPGD
jgi:glycosyltransferase involved in cell wall biosynthesis